MLKTVRNPENEGVGIAAPQVGILRRLVAVQRFDKEGEPFEFYVNPEIVEYGEPKEYGSEGCLSVPNHRGEVLRSRCITLRYRDLQFKRQTEIIEDFTAVIFQHEIDHLDGILYIDRISDTPNGEVAEETTKQ
jgi:peptide deformylase